MKTIPELVEKYRVEIEELLKLAKGTPLRFMLWGDNDDPDAIVSVLKPSDSLERNRGFIGKPDPRGYIIRPYDDKTERALEFLLSFGHSFSLFTTPQFRFFIMKDANGWEVTAKGLAADGRIDVWRAGKGHPPEAVCGLVKSLTDSFAVHGRALDGKRTKR